MRKLLKKKVNVFGKGIPVLAIFVLGIALVSAALIPFWGTITGSVVVESPMQQAIAQGLVDASSITEDSVTFTNLVGGGTIRLSTLTKNLATDKTITGKVENLVVGSDGATPLEDACGEFSKLWIRTDSNGDLKDWPQVNGVMPLDSPICTDGTGFIWEEDRCWANGLDICTSTSDTMTIAWGPEENTWGIGQIDLTQIKAEFRVNAIGTYTFTSQIEPVITP